MTLALILVAGLAGTLARFATERALDAGRERPPWGLLVVNVVGSAVLGALVALAGEQRIGGDSLLILGTGFCGALTTYSGASLATVRLASRGGAHAVMFALGLAFACVAAATAGAALAA